MQLKAAVAVNSALIEFYWKLGKMIDEKQTAYGTQFFIFDFLTLAQPYKEKDIEGQLVDHVTKFLLELGKGFAFLGRQCKLEIAETGYFIDLLFYHTKLKCYVVIELKNTKFIPEFAGKLNGSSHPVLFIGGR